MPNPTKSLAIALAAFYTICSCFAACADDQGTTSSAILRQIDPSVIWRFDEWRELIFDYLYALKEEGQSAAQQLESLTELCKRDQRNQQFRYGPVYVQHWLIPLRDFHVTDLASMKLLDQALSSFVRATPLDVSSQAAESLWKLGNEVQQVETTSAEDKRLKVMTIWQLALLTQKDKVFGRKLGTLALEQMVEFADIPATERRDAIFRSLYGYSEHPRTKYDGDLLYRDVIAVAKLIRQSKDLDDLANAGYLYHQLSLRCSPEMALKAQIELADAAKLAKPNETIMSSINLQLASAYMSVNQFDKAEKVLREIPNSTSIVKLLILECLCQQDKHTETAKLAEKLELLSSAVDVKNPGQIIAVAKAIRARNCIDQKKYASALPLLVYADQRFSNGTSQDNLLTRELPYLEQILPGETQVLSNLILVYDKLGRKEDKRRAESALIKVQEETLRNGMLRKKDELLSLAAVPENENDRTIEQAKHYLQVVRTLSKSAQSETNQVLEYAELLIAYGKEKSGEVCLDYLAKERIAKGNTDSDSEVRLSIDRVLLAEAKGDFDSAAKLLRNLKASSRAISLDNQLRLSEADARLSLLNGNYEEAENKSRILESVLEQTSNVAPEYGESKRDKFVHQHYYALLDRVQSLNYTKKFKESAKLARLLLRTSQWSIDHLGADASANLAYAYAQDGHLGLSTTFTQEAEYKSFGSYNLPPSLYLADTKERLADLYTMQNKPLRAKRYRAEANEIRAQLQSRS